MNMPIAMPKNYKPHHPGAPEEVAGYATPAEWKLLAAMTDGTLEQTENGPSAYMETTGGFKGGTTGIGTGSQVTHTSPQSGATQSGQNAATHAAQTSGGQTNSSGGTPTGQHGSPTGPLGGQGPGTGNPGYSSHDTTHEAFNKAIQDSIASKETPQYTMGAGADVPLGQNAELHVLKDLIDQGVGWQKNAYTATPEALGKLGKLLSGETIKGVGAGEVANSLINRARNPSLYSQGKAAMSGKQYESLDASQPKIAKHMAADVPGSANFDNAVNIATNALANPDMLNKEAINATDFQAAKMSAANGFHGVNVGGNVFGNNYTKPTMMSSLSSDFSHPTFADNLIGGSPMPIATSGAKPTQVASADDTSWYNDPAQYSGIEGVKKGSPADVHIASTAGVPEAQAPTSSSFDLSSYLPDALKNAATTAGQQFTDANKKINSVGGADNAVKLAKLAEAFGFFGGHGTGKAPPTSMDRSRGGGGGLQKDIMSDTAQTNKLPIASSGVTKESLLKELSTTTDPIRYAQIIALLNNTYDTGTIRYGVQMGAAA